MWLATETSGTFPSFHLCTISEHIRRTHSLLFPFCSLRTHYLNNCLWMFPPFMPHVSGFGLNYDITYPFMRHIFLWNRKSAANISIIRFFLSFAWFVIFLCSCHVISLIIMVTTGCPMFGFLIIKICKPNYQTSASIKTAMP